MTLVLLQQKLEQHLYDTPVEVDCILREWFMSGQYLHREFEQELIDFPEVPAVDLDFTLSLALTKESLKFGGRRCP